MEFKKYKEVVHIWRIICGKDIIILCSGKHREGKKRIDLNRLFSHLLEFKFTTPLRNIFVGSKYKWKDLYKLGVYFIISF